MESFEHLARDVLPGVEDSTDSLCPVVSNHYDLVISVCLPYIIQASSAVLSQCAVTDVLHPSEMEILSALHWLLLDETTPYSTQANQKSRKILLDYSTVELFVSSLIPVVLNLTEEDFEGQNRSAWTNLWAPLVNSSLPNVALLVQPCLQMPKKHRPPTPDECAVWLDIAALHSLSWSYWSDFARVWSLMYLKTRLATLSKVKPIPVIFSSSTSTILSADEGNSSGSFPFAGPIRLEKYLDEQTLNFEVVVDAITSMYTPENADIKVQQGSLLLLRTCVDLCNKKGSRWMMNSATDMPLRQRGACYQDTLFQKIVSALLEVTSRCGCHLIGCRPGIKGLDSASLIVQIRNLFSTLCQINHRAVAAHLTSFASVSHVDKTLTVLHTLLNICCSANSRNSSLSPRDGQDTPVAAKDDETEDAQPSQQQTHGSRSEGSGRKVWQTATGAGEFIMNLAGRSLRAQPNGRATPIDGKDERDLVASPEKRERMMRRGKSPLTSRKTTELDLSSSANRKAKLPRRQLCKSKSYTAKLPQLLIDMTGVDLDSAFDAPDVDAPAAPKFVDAKLNGFILKNMLKPLVTQLSKLDLVSAENEAILRDAARLIAYAGKHFEQTLRGVLLHCLLTTRTNVTRNGNAKRSSNTNKRVADLSHSSVARSTFSNSVFPSPTRRVLNPANSSDNGDGDVFCTGHLSLDSGTDNVGRIRNFTAGLAEKEFPVDGTESTDRAHSLLRNFIPEGILRRSKPEARESFQLMPLATTLSATKSLNSKSHEQLVGVPLLTRENAEEEKHSSLSLKASITPTEAYLDGMDCQVVHSDLLNVATLLQCTETGTLPDAMLVAAVIDMDCSPITRAAFLIECTMLVKDCREKKTPAYLTIEDNSCRNMAQNFWRWGQAIGLKLHEIVKQLADPTGSSGIAVTIHDVDGKTEGHAVNKPSATHLYQLSIVACRLLLEISMYLRELINTSPSRGTSVHRIGSTIDQMSRPAMFGSRSLRHDVLKGTGNTRTQFTMVAEAAAAAAASRSMIARGSIPTVPSPAWIQSKEDTQLSAAVDSRSKHSSTSNEDKLGVDMVQCGPTISVEAAGSVFNSPVMRRAAHGQDGNPNLALPATDLLVPWAQSRTPSITSSVSGGSAMSVASLDSDQQSRRQSLGTTSSYHSSRLRMQPLRRGLKTRHEKRASGPDISIRKEIHSPRWSAQIVEGDYQLFAAKECEHLPWLDAVGELLSGLCSEPGACLFSQPPSAMQEEECACIKYLDCKNLLQAVAKIYDHDQDGIVQRKKSRGTGVSHGHYCLPKELEDRIAAGAGQHQGLGLDSKFVLDLDPMRGIKRTTAKRQRSMTGGLGLATLSIVNPVVQTSTTGQQARDQDKSEFLQDTMDNMYTINHRTLLSSVSVLSKGVFGKLVETLWYQLSSSNQDVALNAGCLFLLAGIRQPDKVRQQLQAGLKSTEAKERVESLQRFLTLWNCRTQVWTRADQDAQRTFKVSHTRIAISLPHPLIGIATGSPAYPPWLLNTSGENTADTTSSEADTPSSLAHRFIKSPLDLIAPPEYDKGNLAKKSSTEEDHSPNCGCKMCEQTREARRQRTRITELNLIQEASVDQLLDKAAAAAAGPGAANLPSTAEEYTAHRRNVLFPPSVSFASLLIVQLLKDTSAGLTCGATVRDIAKEVICHCVVDEPALFFRPFMERATNVSDCSKCLDLLRLVVGHVTPLPALCSHFLVNFLLAIVIHHSKYRTTLMAQDIISKTLSILWMVVYSCHGIDLKMLKERLKKEYCDTDVLATSRGTTVKRVIVRLPEGNFLSEVSVEVTGETTFGAITAEALSRVGQTDDGSYCLLEPKTGMPLVATHYIADLFSRRREHREDLTVNLITMTPEIHKQVESLAFGHRSCEMSRILFASSTMSMPGSAGMSFDETVNFLHHELSHQKAFPRRALDSDFELFHFLQDKEGLYGCNKLHKHVWVRFVGVLFDGLSRSFQWGPEASLFLNVLNGALLLHHDDSALLRHVCATYINASRKFVNLFPLHGYQAILPALLSSYSSSSEDSVVRKSVEFTCRQFYNRHDVGFILQLLSSAAHLLFTSKSKAPFFVKSKKEHSSVSPMSVFSLLQSLCAPFPEDPLSITDAISIPHMKGQSLGMDASFAFQGTGHHRDLGGQYSQLPQAALEKTTTSSGSHFGKSFTGDSLQEQRKVVATQPPATARVMLTSQKRGADFGEVGRLDVPFSLVECLRIMVSVVAFDAESVRGAEMLHVLKELMPFLLNLDEHRQIPSLMTNVKALIRGSEVLARYISLQSFPEKTVRRSSAFDRHRPLGQTASSKVSYPLEDTTESFNPMARVPDRAQALKGSMVTSSLAKLAEFREPRNCLLHIAADFAQHDDNHIAAMDSSSLQILMKVAASLTKTASNNNDEMALECKGLHRFFTDVLPVMDWKSSRLQPFFVRLLDRVAKLLQRLHSQDIRWRGLSHIFHGLYLVVQKQPTTARFPAMLRTTEEMIRFILTKQDYIQRAGGATGTLFRHMKPQYNSLSPLTSISTKMYPKSEHSDSRGLEPKEHGVAVTKHLAPCMAFCEVGVQLLAAHMSIMGSDFSLEYICGPIEQFHTVKRLNDHILSALLLPLCIRLGSGQPDTPKILQRDVDYALECILTSLASTAQQKDQEDDHLPKFNPIMPVMSTISISKKESIVSSIHEQLPAAFAAAAHRKSLSNDTYRLKAVAYHGLKIISVCFERQLAPRFHTIAHSLTYAAVSRPLMDFMEFVLTSHSPLEVFLRPLIIQKLDEVKGRKCLADVASRINLLLSQRDCVPTPHRVLLCQLAKDLSSLTRDTLNREGSDDGLSVISHEGDIVKSSRSTMTLGGLLISTNRDSSLEPLTVP